MKKNHVQNTKHYVNYKLSSSISFDAGLFLFDLSVSIRRLSNCVDKFLPSLPVFNTFCCLLSAIFCPMQVFFMLSIHLFICLLGLCGYTRTRPIPSGRPTSRFGHTLYRYGPGTGTPLRVRLQRVYLHLQSTFNSSANTSPSRKKFEKLLK